METATHIPTGRFCTILQRDAAQRRSFCNFGSMTNPFTWVADSELRQSYSDRNGGEEHPDHGGPQ